MFTNMPQSTVPPPPYPKLTPPEMLQFLQARGWWRSVDYNGNELWQNNKYYGNYFEPAEAVLMELMQMNFVQGFRDE